MCTKRTTPLRLICRTSPPVIPVAHWVMRLASLAWRQGWIHWLDGPGFFGTQTLKSGIQTGTSIALSLQTRSPPRREGCLWLAYLPFFSHCRSNATLRLYSALLALLNFSEHFDMSRGLSCVILGLLNPRLWCFVCYVKGKQVTQIHQT